MGDDQSDTHPKPLSLARHDQQVVHTPSSLQQADPLKELIQFQNKM